MSVMDSLQGGFLISTQQMPDPRFQERVVYMCAHSDEGAMGVIINQPVEHITIADILKSADIPMPDFPLPPIYIGGPVDMNTAFVLFTTDYKTENQLPISETVSISSDLQIVKDIAAGRGPKDYLFLLGYSGWAPGQLENELTVNGWLSLPASDDILFHTPDELKWKRAAERYGIDITVFGDVVGTA